MLTEVEELEYIDLLKQEMIDKARDSFWYFCNLLSPDFYRSDRIHLKQLCDTLQSFYYRELTTSAGKPAEKLIIEMPPRHGKSRTLTNFSAWVLGLDNTNKIITASHNDELAQDFSRHTRDIIAQEKNLPDQIVYSDIFTACIKKGDAAYHKWALDGQFFNYKGTGIGGSVTGRGGNCFVKNTKVATKRGDKNIQDITIGDEVVTYDHEKNILEYKRVTAIRRSAAHGIVRLTTSSGGCIRCTGGHRIYVSGKGYIEAKNISKRDTVQILKNTKINDFKMLSLWKRIYQGVGGIYQKSSARWERFLLFSRVFVRAPFFQKLTIMSNMWKTSKRQTQEILFTTMQARPKRKDYKIQALSLLWNYICRKVLEIKVLFTRVQKQNTLDKYEKKGQPELQTWKCFGNVPGGVSKEKISSCKSLKDAMSSLWFGKKNSGSSQGQKSVKQCGRKFNNCLQFLSCKTSQIKNTTFRDTRTVMVYDIQVEDNHNFFANGILVHNCLIVDDPIKDAQVAYNPSALENIWLWYTGTFMSRAEEGAIEILCMTPWAKGDMGARLRALAPDECYVLSMPACTNGVMLCPDLLSFNSYNERKAIADVNIFAANYDMQRLDVKGRLYSGFQTYSVIPENARGKIGYVDTADEGKDYLCAILGVQANEYIYITDILFTQDAQELTEPKLCDMIAANGTREIMVESNNGGRAFARNIQRILQERRYSCAVQWFHQTSNKQARILTNAPIAQKYLLLPEGWAQRWQGFYSAIMSYQREGKNKHDDAPDCITGLIEHYGMNANHVSIPRADIRALARI